MIAKLIANIAIIAAVVFLSILVMEYGWGVTPKSWWWIIGAGFFGQTVLYSIRRAIDKEK